MDKSIKELLKENQELREKLRAMTYSNNANWENVKRLVTALNKHNEDKHKNDNTI